MILSIDDTALAPKPKLLQKDTRHMMKVLKIFPNRKRCIFWGGGRKVWPLLASQVIF